MRTAKEKKSEVITNIKEKVSKSSFIAVTDYKGFTVSEITSLRKQLQENNSEYKIAKNTLIKLAAKETSLAELEKFLEGPTALLLGYGEATECAKTFFNFSKEIEKGSVRAAIFEGKVLTTEEFKTFANLPSREVLLGQIAGLLTANTASIVGVFESLIRDIALLSEEVAKKNSGETSKATESPGS